MKWYKRDPDRALAGMAELTLQQRGGYNSLLDLLYSRDGDLPDDDARVARMMQCHRSEWKAVKRQLMDLGKVWIDAGKLCANGVQTTLKEATNFSQTQRERVGKRWEKHENDKQNKAPAIRSGNTNTTTPTTTSIKKKEQEEFSLEPLQGSALVVTAPIVISIPTVSFDTKGEEVGYTQAKIDEWTESYPGVDVVLAMKAARQWCIDKPAKRKTKKGMNSFINGWLARVQNQGGNRNGRQSHNPALGSAANSRLLQGAFIGVEAANSTGPGEEQSDWSVAGGNDRALLQR